MAKKKMVVTVLGCGHVGSSIAWLLMDDNRFNLDINIMCDTEVNEGRLMELKHCQAFHHKHRLYINNAEMFHESDVVFHAAAVKRKIIGSRMEVLKENMEVTDKVFRGVRFKKDVRIIVLSNPVDIISWYTWKVTGLEHWQVIGSGTLIDSVRMAAIVAERMGLQSSDVFARVVGEHGETMTPLISQLRVKGNTIDHKYLNDEDFIHSVRQETIFAARKIKLTQEATYMGIAECAVRMMDALFQKDETFNWPASVLLPDACNIKLKVQTPIYISVPLILGNKKYKVDNSVELTEREWSQLRVSAIYLENIIKGL